MAECQRSNLRFFQFSDDLLRDCLDNLNRINKEKLKTLPKSSGVFKGKRIIEYTLLITDKLRLEPVTAYHAVELLQRFMVKYTEALLTMPTTHRTSAPQPTCDVEAVLEKLMDQFPLILFSCVQVASKLSLHQHVIGCNTLARFLRSAGLSVSKQTVLESELQILKGLEFRVNPPNPLTYLEILLEVLGHNDPSIPVERLHGLSCHVLHFISLEKKNIYDSLLVATAKTLSPSQEQRDMFVTVTEDYMLRGVGVIAVVTFILHVGKWKQVVEQLSHITAIASKSIRDFAHVTLLHIVDSSPTVSLS